MEVFSPGQRLAERYLLAEPIGSGGMSHVWRAVDEVLRRPVAVKTLDAALHADPHLRTAIRREARAAASITHPHVTQVYDFGEEPLPAGGVAPYLVMELLVGQNLADRLGFGPLPWPQAVAVCAAVAGALGAAHRLGVVHRDIKPANVMLTEGGAKVVDFGIAALVAGPDEDGLAPRAGTPAYLAPEVLTGSAGSPESDMYALGALLHTSLTGMTPFAVKTWAQATLAHERGALPAPILVPDLPQEVRELCARCLSPLMWSRPTADEAAEVLGRWSAPVGALAGSLPGQAGTAMVGRPAPVLISDYPTLFDAASLDAQRHGPAPVPVKPPQPPKTPQPLRTPQPFQTAQPLKPPVPPTPGPPPSPVPPASLGSPARGSRFAPSTEPRHGTVRRARRRRRRGGLAVIGMGLALAGIILVSVAAGLLSPDDLRFGGLTWGEQSASAPAGGLPLDTGDPGAADDPPLAAAPETSVSPTPGPADATPSSPAGDPSTASAALSAIESEVAAARSQGRINAQVASTLTDDVRNMRDGVNAGSGSELQRSARRVQRQVDSQVGQGGLDATVGEELNRLLDILIRLSAVGR